jgi:hypothetical protein
LRQLGRLKVNVAIALGTAGFAVGDDAGRDDAADGFEDSGEPILVNVPGEIADKDGGGAAGRGGVVGFDSFGGGVEGFRFSLWGRFLFFFFLVGIFFFIFIVVLFFFR